MLSRMRPGLFILLLTVVSWFALPARAQTTGDVPARAALDGRASGAWVTASVGAEQVRYLAPASVYQIRLEVFIANGDKLYDSGFRFGNLLDWNWQDQQGSRLADGLYHCHITIKDFSGQLGQRHGVISLEGGEARLQAPEREPLAIREANSLATIDRHDLLLPLAAGASSAATVIAHDGSSGRIASTSGGLSFRTGNFFAGRDVEQIRLTPEGNLGIGVENPQAKLDVAGLIRTSKGIMFPDGTIQTTAANVSSRTVDGRGGIHRTTQPRALREQNSGDEAAIVRSPVLSISGSGTANFITKWLSSSVLGTSTIFENAAGNIGIGTASPSAKLHINAGVSGSPGLWADTSGSGAAVLGFTAGSGRAGYFQVSNPANISSALYAQTNGSGRALETLATGSGDAVFGYTIGTGRAGYFQINNPSNSSSALYATTNGGGNALLATTTGTGNAGDFRVDNPDSNASAVHVTTNGKDAAVRGVHTGSSGNGGDFMINNANNSSNAVRGHTRGKGNAGDFRIDNPDSNASAVHVTTNGKDAAVRGVHTGGSGNGGDFQINNASNSYNAVRGYTKGIGNAGEFVIDNTSSSASALYVSTNGTGYAANFNGSIKTDVLVISGGSDLSERFEVKAALGSDSSVSPQPIQPGLVVSIDPDGPGKLAVSGRAYDRRVAGIISGAGGVKPGMLMGQAGSIADGSHPVALTGRVYCWADVSNGPINPGDLLTTSNLPGHAMKVADHVKAQGAIIGKAMTGLTKGQGLVLVLITLQ